MLTLGQGAHYNHHRCDYTTFYMEAGGSTNSNIKLSSVLVTEWPKPFDIKHDIFIPNKATTFRRQLRAALETRGLLAALEEQPLTMLDVQGANPHASTAEIMAAVDKASDNRQKQLVTISQHLAQYDLGLISYAD